jgi:hypothetical protein
MGIAMMKLLSSLSLTAWLCLSSQLTALPEPYNSVNTLPIIYYYVPDGYVLYSLATENSSSVIVDVESDNGSVARYLAQQNIPSVTKVYSVSLWAAGNPPEYDRYQRFLSNVIQEGTAEVIVPLRMSSAEAASALNVSADLIYFGTFDSNTLYDEIAHWIGNLSDNGVLCGNNWNENAIKVAVVNAANDFNLNLGINSNVWYLKKN